MESSDNASHLKSELECPICMNRYKIGKNCPRILSCGHTICTSCILRIKKASNTCGECRTVIKHRNTEDMPVNFSILRLLDTLDNEINKNHQFVECENLIKDIDIQIEEFIKKKTLFSTRAGWMSFKNKRLTEAIQQLQKSKTILKDKAAQISKIKSLSELGDTINEARKILGKIKQDVDMAASRVYLDFIKEDLNPIIQAPDDYLYESENKRYCSLTIRNKRIFIFSAKSHSRKYLQNKKIITGKHFTDYRTGVFLQIESDGMMTYLEFDLDESTHRAKIFSSLCLTDMKTGFKNSSFYEPKRVCMEGENISFGKPSKKTLTDQVTSSKTLNQCIKKGSLVGDPSYPIFSIYLEGWPPKYTDDCFGRMTCGSTFLHNSIINERSIRIVECGWILDFKKNISPADTSPREYCMPVIEPMEFGTMN